MDLILLLDVDNTLLDNDAVKADLADALERTLEPGDAARFWDLYEEVREDLGVVSFPETIERFLPTHCADPLAPQRAAETIFGLDLAARLRPGAIDLIRWAMQQATPLILSNGDQLFQRWKIWRAGLTEAAGGRVWVFPEKEEHFGDLDARFGTQVRYLLFEDKVGALEAARRHWRQRVTTVLSDFGHHAEEREPSDAVDLVVSTPAELLDHLLRGLVPGGIGDVP